MQARALKWCWVLAAWPRLASAGPELSLRLEPGLTVPVAQPQTQAFNPGGVGSLKASLGLSRYLGVGPSASLDALPSASAKSPAGTAWSLGGGLRLQRPHDLSTGTELLRAVSPWASLDALYVRTGPFNRPGFAVALGAALPLGESHALWLGPFVRYFQIVTPARPGVNATDAKLVSVGVSLEFDTGPEAEETGPAPILEVAPLEVVASRPPAPVPAPLDTDGDGVPDDDDACPTVAGPASNHGCPFYKQVVVTDGHLELTERLYFAHNKAALQPRSFPVLDDVARALRDHRGLQVEVLGHADSTGNERHNHTLSERRAEAVRARLISLGIDEDRLRTHGFGSSRPIDTNASNAGRERNRRVEFVVDTTSGEESSR